MAKKKAKAKNGSARPLTSVEQKRADDGRRRQTVLIQWAELIDALEGFTRCVKAAGRNRILDPDRAGEVVGCLELAHTELLTALWPDASRADDWD